MSALSAFTGTTASIAIPTGAPTRRRTETVVTQQRGADLQVFSKLTGRWHTAPRGSNTTQVSRSGCLVAGSAGWHAFSARTGQFFAARASTSATPLADSNATVVGLRDGNQLRAFAPVARRWVATALNPTASFAAKLNGEILVVENGMGILAFSSRRSLGA